MNIIFSSLPLRSICTLLFGFSGGRNPPVKMRLRWFLCLLLVSLSGCFPPPPTSDPLAELDAIKFTAQPPVTPAMYTAKSDVDSIPSAKAPTNQNSYAIVIGIENYRQNLPNAEFATHDAQTVTEYLTKVLGYPEENVITLLNDRALKSDLTKYFEKWLGNNVEADSTVFIY